MSADDHGSYSTYTNHRCRCQPCRDAFARWQQLARQRRKAQGLAADDPRHGSASTYSNHGCRCDECKAAHATYARERNRRLRADSEPQPCPPT